LYREKEITVGLGNTRIGMRCRDKEFMGKLATDYEPFLVPGAPDINIEFNISDNYTAPEIKELMTGLRAFRDGEHYYTEPELIECRLRWHEACLKIKTQKHLFDPEVDYRFLNTLLRGLYTGIYRKLRKTDFNDYLVHGCGVAEGNRCYLFTGPSGSGKTTVAGLAGGRDILNDEAVLLGRNNGGFRLGGTPFDGGIPERNNSRYHLSAIFFLKHDRQVTIRKLNQIESYKRLLTQVFDTSPLFELPDNDTFSEQAELCSEVASVVSSYELGFLPDASFWQHIENI
jgi:hypothetical protein